MRQVGFAGMMISFRGPLGTRRYDSPPSVSTISSKFQYTGCTPADPCIVNAIAGAACSLHHRQRPPPTPPHTNKHTERISIRTSQVGQNKGKPQHLKPGPAPKDKGGCIFSVPFFGGVLFLLLLGRPFDEGRKEGMPGERKEGRKEKNGSKNGRKKDKKERNENPAMKEGRNARRKEGRKEGSEEGGKEGRKIKERMENPGRKEGRNAKEERNKGRKEGRRNKGSKKGRKQDMKERTENPYTLNPNPSHTNHTTTNNNHNRKTTIQ